MGDALTSNVDPPLSVTAVGDAGAEDVNPPSEDGVVGALAANPETAELAVAVPHAARTAKRKAATAVSTVAFV